MRPTLALLALVLAASLGLGGPRRRRRPGPARPTAADPPRGAPRPVPQAGRARGPAEPPRQPGRRRPRAAGPAPSPPARPDRRPPAGRAEPAPADPDRPAGAGRRAQAPDAPVRRTQATAADLGMPIGPGTDSTAPVPGGQSLSLQQALTGALTSNPDLVALRQGNPAQASAEAVEVARHFPVALNPTVFIDYRPITLIPNGTFGTTGTGHRDRHRRRRPARARSTTTARATSWSPSASRSSSATRPPTATRSPRRPTSRSSGRSSRPS